MKIIPSKTTWVVLSAAVALALSALTGCKTPALTAPSTNQQSVGFKATPGGSGTGCPGAYTGFARMTNSAGTFLLTPPTNTIRGTFTDASGFAAPYISVAWVARSGGFLTWCDTNSVTFPVTNGAQYSLTVYVKSPLPPPTNGQPMTLKVTWQ